MYWSDNEQLEKAFAIFSFQNPVHPSDYLHQLNVGLQGEGPQSEEIEVPSFDTRYEDILLNLSQG